MRGACARVAAPACARGLATAQTPAQQQQKKQEDLAKSTMIEWSQGMLERIKVGLVVSRFLPRSLQPPALRTRRA